jgi:hypothetical protein
VSERSKKNPTFIGAVAAVLALVVLLAIITGRSMDFLDTPGEAPSAATPTLARTTSPEAAVMPEANPTPPPDLILPQPPAEPALEQAGELDQEGTLWAPYLEWALENPIYPGNPFDLVAWVTFVHSESGEVRRTQMFYAGEDTWKFRFTGTRTGGWAFQTESDEAPFLDGISGKVTIHPNPDPEIRGFLVSYGNKFARQVGDNGELEAFIFNVWQGGDYPNDVLAWYRDTDIYQHIDFGIENYVRAHGMTVVYSNVIGNRWFNLETQAWDEHDSENPDLRTFEGLEKAIAYVHSKGLHLHIWKWGDENRRQTPLGVGGINGEADRRLQRYIAARLGPLAGWSMGYGFDLGDPNWVRGNEDKLESWAEYMLRHMGWPHLLFTRGYAPPSISGVSYSSNGPGSTTGAIQTSPNGPMTYEEVVRHIESDLTRPHLYEERFIYLREFEGGPPWTDERTRRVMWWNTLAGGVGAFWGVWDGPIYADPAPLRTHYEFWKDRFLLDMERANYLTDGYALITPDRANLVFYKEDTASITMDLRHLPRSMNAAAVDTARVYAEITLGMLEPGVHHWEAPYESDWAIAVGFD